jgi:hypothetical protein
VVCGTQVTLAALSNLAKTPWQNKTKRPGTTQVTLAASRYLAAFSKHFSSASPQDVHPIITKTYSYSCII